MLQGPSSSGKAVATKGIGGIGPAAPPFAINGDEWDGNFADGETAFWTNSPGQGPITLTFDAPIQAFGVQVQTDFFGPFTVRLDVFSQGILLASATADGDSNNLGDDSALFFGYNGDFAQIDMVTYSIVNCANDCGDFAINSLIIGEPNQVPEPGTLVMLGSSVLGIGAMLRRRFIP